MLEVLTNIFQTKNEKKIVGKIVILFLQIFLAIFGTIFSWLNIMILLSLSIDDVSFGMLAVVLGVSPILYKSKKLGEARTPPNLEQ